MVNPVSGGGSNETSTLKVISGLHVCDACVCVRARHHLVMLAHFEPPPAHVSACRQLLILGLLSRPNCNT